MSYLQGTYLVPALPHMLQCKDANAGYRKLYDAMLQIKAELAAQKVERVVYYSTAWIAVLGQMIQAREDLRGDHVDDNWYEYGTLNFAMRIDAKMSKHMSQGLAAEGHSVRLVDYEGFPLDTGTLVAQTLIDPVRLPSTIVANHVYTDFAGTKKLAAILRQSIEAYGKRTAVVVVSGLSQRFFTQPIDVREDCFSSPDDDRANLNMLKLFGQGSYQAAEDMVTEYAHATKADMGFKALGFLRGILGESYRTSADVKAYAPVYGTGAAVVGFK